MEKIPLTIAIMMFVFLFACDGGKNMDKQADYNNLENVPASAWKSLSQKTVFFGHQSVGFNILEGIRDIEKENTGTIALNIVETLELERLKKGTFAHAKVGENKKPLSKIKAFATYMNLNSDSPPDIAFFKFCYVDITAETDTQAVFDDYKNTMQSLQETFPKTAFIHVTTPLMIVQTGVKAWIKKLLKKDMWEYADNIKRNQFNALLRKQYGQTDPVFDLAKAESTYPDGSRSTFSLIGTTYYSLVPAYTEDGGHLNASGRKSVAKKLLVCLAEIASN